MGKSGTGVEEQTGNTVVYNSDGSTTEGIRSLPEFTVTSPNPVQDGVYKARREFAKGALGATSEATGLAGAAATASGLTVAPFVPTLGWGLVIVGETLSGISGIASLTKNLLEGNVNGAITDGVLLAVGAGGTVGIKSIKSLDSTGETILRGTQNTTLDITSQFIVPTVQKKKR